MKPYNVPDVPVRNLHGGRAWGAPASLVGLSIIAALATMIGCSGGNSSTSSLGASVKSGAQKTYTMSIHGQHAVVGPPASGVYVGAFVNPSAIPSPSPSILEEQTEQLESAAEMNRPLAMHLEYRNWAKMAALTTGDPQIAGYIAYGRVPVISWTCADDIVPSPEPTGWAPYNLIQIANGYADSDLRNIRTALINIKAPGGGTYPIILRWFWEFNINAGSGPPGYTNSLMESRAYAGSANGFVQPGTVTNIPNPGATAPGLPKQFTAAWIHIYATLLGTQPLPPFTFDWNPNVATTFNGYPSPAPFYPGDAYVDWIGADGYAKLNGSNPQTFSQIFGGWYNTFDTSSYSKPLMIGETGSCSLYVSPEQTQAGYIQGIETIFDTNASPSFPADIKAINYFDTAGQYQIAGQPCNWAFSSDGLSAWETLVNDPKFSPMVPGT